MRVRCSIPAAITGAIALLALAPAASFAHGGESMEAENLSQQPARTLAQQALAELRVRHDTEQAATLLDAAVESEDQRDVDTALVNNAMETLDAGDETHAVSMLDQALSRPLGEQSGAALHESGREFQPATGTQEIVAIVLGAVALALAALLLARGRRERAASP
jgi:LPXTG-motif cell wall-anchored protein